MALPLPARLAAPLASPPLRVDLVAALDAQFDPAALAALLGLAPEQVPAALWRRALVAPARDVLGRPAKQLRARLCEAAYLLAGGQGAPPPELAVAVEALHAGSLVVDDIEDEALTRRGRPALHRLVGVPVALNTGNWMYFWAGTLVAQAHLPPERALTALSDLQTALVRCHHGQALDLAARVDELDRVELPGVVAAATRLKTGSLFELATRLGAHAAGGAADAVHILGAFGRELGEALQMLDDLSSVCNPARRDKAHEDLAHARPTWPWAWLAERVDDAAWERAHAARRELEVAPAGEAAVRVAALAEELRLRVGGAGRLRVRAAVDGALARLRSCFGAAAVAEVEDDVERLEQSYA
jgi:geranylgeranyl pyrophosphate synthase